MLKNIPSDREAYYAFISRRKERLAKMQAQFEKLYSYECTQGESGSGDSPVQSDRENQRQPVTSSDAAIIDKLLKLQLSEKPDSRDLPFQSCRDLSAIVDNLWGGLDHNTASEDDRDVTVRAGRKRSLESESTWDLNSSDDE